ncbi:uncharacterized protein EDB91DRAFT_825965 [Suillus paluster]|uniref:uncharacterized protein n=1 Tax=Suillus paluster TaxID=48578 RepID=UPI001B87A4B3|nr:uncharacterized protein EDB91DRAFT_825965 [Suillus paluster]KAG1748969.1 hypothetical protein EDB91DRAFT_825965 [Suillus paluster]
MLLSVHINCLFCTSLLLGPLSSISIKPVSLLHPTSTRCSSTTRSRPSSFSGARSNSLIVDDTTSPPSPSKARKLRILSNLSLFKKTSLSKVFKKVPAIQTLPIVLHRTTTAALDPLRHIPAVSEDGFLHFATPSPTEHQECGTDFGLISSTVDESSNQEDINPDPPGSRIADRVTSLRMRTAAVWASIPATMEGLPASCVSSEASTPVKSQINFLEQDETTSVETATVDSPLFSSPATSATAVSDWGPRDSLVNPQYDRSQTGANTHNAKGFTCVRYYLPRTAARVLGFDAC